MSNSHKIIPLLVALVTFVYVLRNDNISSATFLSSNSPRALEVQESTSSQSTVLKTICKDYVHNKPFPESRVKLAENMNYYLDKLRGGNKLVSIIKDFSEIAPIVTEDSAVLAVTAKNREEVAISYAKTMTLYVVFIVIFLLSSIYCCFGFCCVSINKCQKPCCCFHAANSEKGKIACGIVSLVLVVALMGIGFLGVISAQNVDDDASQAVCSMSYSLEGIINGDMTRHWLGLSPTVKKLDEMLANINALQSHRDILDTTYKSVNNAYQKIQDEITSSYNEFKDKELPRVDTTIASTYQPTFITNYGPPSTESTITSSFMKETIVDLSDFVTAGNSILTGIEPVLNQQNGLNPYIEKGKSTTLLASSAVQNILDFSDEYSEQMDSIFAGSQKALKILFGVLAAIPAYCAVWWMVNFLCGAKVHFFLNFGWVLLGLISIIGWFVSVAFTPASIGLMEACGAINEAFTDQTLFNKSINLFLNNPQAANQYLYPCIFGDPDIPTAFGLLPPTEEFFTFYDQSVIHSNTINQVASLPPTLSSVPNQIGKLGDMRVGLEFDAKATEDDLKKLNLNSQSTSGCEPMKDTWTLSSTACSAAAGTASMLQSNSDSWWNAGSPTCIGFNLWTTGTKKDIRTRYDTMKYVKDCQDTSREESTNVVETLVPSFISNRAALGSLITDLTNSLNKINSAYSGFVNQIQTVSQQSKNVNSDLQKIVEVFNNQNTGILNNMKCKVIPEDLKVLQSTLCIGFVPTTFQFALITFAFSLVSTFGAFALFCLSRKLRSVQETQTDEEETPGTPQDPEKTPQGKEKKKKKVKKEFEMTATRVY